MRPPNSKAWAFAICMSLFTVMVLGYTHPAKASPATVGHGTIITTQAETDYLLHNFNMALVDNCYVVAAPNAVYLPYVQTVKVQNKKQGGESYAHKERDAI